jgi:hypothetical protein
MYHNKELDELFCIGNQFHTTSSNRAIDCKLVLCYDSSTDLIEANPDGKYTSSR